MKTKKSNWTEYRDILEQQGITTLYHFTDRENLESIIKNGGLYSWADCEKKGIAISRPGGSDVSRDLDRHKGLEHYVRLSFTRNHPMMYVALQDGRLSNPVQLEIDLEAIYWEGTKYSDCNATRNGVHVGEELDDFKKIHFNSIKAEKHFDLSDEEQPYFQAEVLVKEFIPLSAIKNIEKFGIPIPSQPTQLQAREPYTAQISRANPTAFIFIVDHSASMGGTLIDFEGSEMSLATAVQRITNRQIKEIINRCIKGADIRHYYDIAVLGYGRDVYNAWEGDLKNRGFCAPNEIEEHPYKRIKTTKEVTTRRGTTTKEIEEVMWIEDRHDGRQTRMDLAFRRAKEMLADWIAAHPNSYPPTIIHITDGIPVGTSNEAVMQEANELKSMYTNDGNVLLFNIHLAKSANGALSLPTDKSEVEENQYSKFLYELSSLLPMRYNDEIKKHKMGGDKDKRCVAMAVNASADVLVKLMDIGTPTNISKN